MDKLHFIWSRNKKKEKLQRHVCITRMSCVSTKVYDSNARILPLHRIQSYSSCCCVPAPWLVSPVYSIRCWRNRKWFCVDVVSALLDEVAIENKLTKKTGYRAIQRWCVRGESWSDLQRKHELVAFFSLIRRQSFLLYVIIWNYAAMYASAILLLL